MATEITMPKLSDTMTEGRLVSWKKSVGERVERGEIIAEVETDKANMELEAFSSGVLLETRITPGELAPVGTVIAIIGAEGEQVTALVPVAAKITEEMEPEAQPAAKAAAAEPISIVEPEKPQPSVQPVSREGFGAEKASPLVRRLAREMGIDLKEVKGSGPEGRVLKEDLERHEKQVKVEVKVEREARKVEPSVQPTVPQPLSRMRAAIARTVTTSWQTIPHFTVTVAIDMGEAEKLARGMKKAGTRVSLNDLLIKAVALALQKYPQLNASFTVDSIIIHPSINIGIAVSLDEGLLVPVIKGCEALSLKDIASQSRELISRARSGTINAAELSGGTFSISNLGMFGVDQFMAVIFPPQGAILAVGGVNDQPVVKKGEVVPARIMKATISADHRLIDGAMAARFMGELQKVLENPVAMLV